MPADETYFFHGKVPIALLGPDIDHRHSLEEMLTTRVSRVIWIPDSQSFRRGRDAASLRMRLGRMIDQIRGSGDDEYLHHILSALDESDSRLVIAYWGTLPLPDLAAIRKFRPHIKLVLMVLCYPLALTATGIFRQDCFMRRAERLLDGILFPSEEMRSYFFDRVFTSRAPPSIVIPPCWPARFQATIRRESTGNHARLIYAGRTDLGGRTIHAADDIRPLMRAILDAGIELHHAYSIETEDGHPRRRMFRPLPLPDLVEFMGGFDASLLAYNTAVCRRADRFLLTIPDRLITGVAAGIPVAIPRIGYSAAKSYLKKYPAVIEFSTAIDLMEMLADRQLVARMRDAAWASRQCYTALRYGNDMVMFLKCLV